MNHLSVEQIKAQQQRILKEKEQGKKTNKYGNLKVFNESGEKIADSKAEGARLHYLKIRQRIGEISNLRTQVKYNLIGEQVICGKKVTGVSYVADFVYIDKNGNEVVEDVKGLRTADYINKRKLMKFIHNIDVVEIGGQKPKRKSKPRSAA